MPTNVVWFERLAYASLGLGFVVLALDRQNLSRLAPPAALVGMLLLTIAVMALLIWLTARRRQGWARWALLALFLLGLPYFFANLLRQSLLSVPVSLLQTVLQGVALFYVFTGDAGPWFARARPLPLPKVPMPVAVERFEQLGYAGLILAILATLFDLIEAARAPQSSVSKALGGLLEVAAIGIGWLLIWLIARHRQAWARWVLLAFAVIVLGSLALSHGRAPIWIDGLRGLQVVAWLAATGFTYTDEARPWFHAASFPAAAAAPKMRIRVAAGRRIVVEPEEATHRAKVDDHVAEMGRLGIPGWIAAPPPFEWLWSAGIEVPPPLFLGFLPLLLIAAAPATIVWMLPLAFIAPPAVALVLAAWGGLVFGALVAGCYRYRARDLALPAWEDYLPVLRT
jgi:hypothetical protein